MPTLLATNFIQGIPMQHIAFGIAGLCLIIALPAFYNVKKYKEAFEDFFNSGNATLRLASVLFFAFAFLILNTHWTIKFSSNRSIMTVLGYLMLLEGIVWMWFPSFVRKQMIKFVQKNSMVYTMASVLVLIAVGLGYLALKVY